MAEEIRIVIADDHPIVRKGLRATIEEDAGLMVVAEVGDGQEALNAIRKLRPQVAVLDIDMPGLGGFEVAREIRKLKLDTRAIFLTLHAEEDMYRAALELGARGYLLKDSAMAEITVGIRAVASGQLYLSSAITAHLLNRPEPKPPPPVDPLIADLTMTERRILRLIGEGQSSKEIGETLSIHYRTVENHRTNICRKLKIEGTNALLRFAIQHKDRLSSV